MPDGIKLNIAQIIIIGNRYGWKALSFYGVSRSYAAFLVFGFFRWYHKRN